MSEPIIVYSATWCADCRRAKKFLADHRIPYEAIDIEYNAEAVAFVVKANNGMHVIPTLVFPDGSILSEPSNAQLAEKLG